MPVAGLALLVVGVGALVWRGSMRAALAATLAVVMLVPDTLGLPWPGFGYFPIVRIVVAVLAARLVRDARRGDLWFDDLRVSRVHWAFAVHLGVVFLVGAVLAPSAEPLRPLLGTFPIVVDQMLSVGFQLVVFTAVLVACRQIGDLRWLVRLFAVLVGASVVIATLEHLSGVSWGRWFLSGGGRTGPLGVYGLNERGGALRVRAGAQFALAFAWVTALLFPLLVTHAVECRRWLWRVAPAVAAATIVWSGSRSALPTLGVAMVVLVVAARFDRRYVVFTVAGGLIGAVFLFGSPALLSAYSSTEATGSDRTRTDRLAIVAEATARRPVAGLGLGAVSATLGYYGTDASYLQAYVETGVLGLVSLSVLVITAILCAGGGLRAPPGTIERRVAAACVTALLIGAVGAGAYDLFSVPGSNLFFWAVAALGVATADRVRQRRPLTLPSPWRAGIPVAGAAIGMLLAVTAPVHTAVVHRFETVPIRWVVNGNEDLRSLGETMANTACGQLERMPVDPAVDVRCRVVKDSGGVGDLRVQAGDAATAMTFADAIIRRAVALQPAFTARQVGPPATGRPTFAATAPVWLGFAGALLALLLPPPPLRPPHGNGGSGDDSDGRPATRREPVAVT